ncbi:MAG TPA: S8 family peptidase [Thermoanaerobaculia bacterium]
MPRLRVSRLLAAFATTVLALGSAAPAHAAPIHRAERPIPDQYIVVFADSVRHAQVPALVEKLSHAHGAVPLFAYRHALKGFAVRMSDREAAALARNPLVRWIEEDSELLPSATQLNPANWGLDRLDQRYRPLDASYSYTTTGLGVNAYVIDSGISLSHSEFTGRLALSLSFVPGDPTVDDCWGHGSKVAGILGGTTHGVAKQVQFYSLRIATCDNGGAPKSSTIAAFDWLTYNHVKPAVANLSYNAYCSPGQTTAAYEQCLAASAALRDAVRAAIAAGVSVVNSAGNNEGWVDSDPAAGVGELLVAGAVAADDRRVYGTAFGNEIDVYAPGAELTTANFTNPGGGTTTFSMTSAAAPMVAGTVARYLQTHPTATPAQVHAFIVGNATPGVVTNFPSWTQWWMTPPLLLYQAP